MTSTVINPCDLVFYDVNTTTTKKSIAKLLKKHVPNAHWEIRRGKPYRKYLPSLRTHSN
jgi:hypothetical protein